MVLFGFVGLPATQPAVKPFEKPEDIEVFELSPPAPSRRFHITKDANDFSAMPLVRAAAGSRMVKIPAPLAGDWLGLLPKRTRRKLRRGGQGCPLLERLRRLPGQDPSLEARR
jgi:hypothetical protein